MESNYLDDIKKSMDSFHKIKEIDRYNQIIVDYDFASNLHSDTEYIAESLPIMCQIVASQDPYNRDRIHENIDDLYWSAKGIANFIKFIECMKPILKRFNPTDEDKQRFAEFVKSMEQEDE